MGGMRLSGWIVSGAFALTSACDVSVDPDIDLTQVALAGRVFSADDARPVRGAEITTPGEQKTKSDGDGRFMVLYGDDKGGSLKAESDKSAPVSKPAPTKSGYVELSLKSYDAQKRIETKKGGAVVAGNAARVDIPGGALKVKGGSDKPAQATVSIAAPDPRKSLDLASVPGNFDAKKGGKRGKLSADSPLYVRAEGDDKELDLADKKAKVDLPVHKSAGDKALGKTLYRYDEEQGMWVEAGRANRTTNGAGDAVYRCEISSLGWYAVGDFYDKLSCVRGCVRDASGKAAAGATVIATGVDHFSQVATYAGDDGCFALDVRASSELSVVAQTISGIAGPELVTTSDAASSSEGDAGACASLGTLEIERRSADDSECPLGANKCGDACVDLSTDEGHCGRCETPCEGLCTAGKCESGNQPDPDDGGTEPAGDGGVTDQPDGGSMCACTSSESSTGHVLEGCCIGQGCGYRTDQIPLPVTETCLAPNVPRPLAGCPSVTGTTRQVSFGGCCLASGECGVATNEGFMGDTLVDFGFGCVSRAQAGLAGKPVKCDSSPPGPDGGTSTTDSGVVIPDAGVQPADAASPVSDASTSTPALLCIDAECQDELLGGAAGTAQKCCAAKNACGSEPTPFVAQFGFSASCVERDQPGNPEAKCDTLFRESTGGTISMPGCCRPDGVCGFDASDVQTSEGVLDLGLGCISYDDASETGTLPNLCFPIGQ